jgi:uncharacterized protein
MRAGPESGPRPSVATATRFAPPPRHAAAGSVPGASGPSGTPATISVAGFGVARRSPELMRVVLSVEAVRERAAAAMAAAGALADQVVAVARSAGIAAEDIRAGDISLTPDRAEGPYGARVTGYRAGEAFQLTIRRLYYAGPTLELVANACPSQVRIETVAFGVTDQEELRCGAREAAYADAFSRADHYARLAGRTLGPLQVLDEQNGAPGAPWSPISSVSAEPPSVQEQVTVQAVFAIQ